MSKKVAFLKVLSLTLLCAFSFIQQSQAQGEIFHFETPDYKVESTDEYTRLEITNLDKAGEIYTRIRIPESEQTFGTLTNNKFKAFSNVTSDLFFFCGIIENNPFACYFQIKKVKSERLFESPTATSLKLTPSSDSQKWAEALPLQNAQDGRSISALIIDNFMETYCEKSSATGETLCHVTIYKNGKAGL